MNKECQHKCIDCNKLIDYRSERCVKCYHKKRIIRTKVYYCIDCGKEITYGSARCHSCSQSGVNNHQYKNGKNKCIDCGRELVNYRSKRCIRCFQKYFIANGMNRGKKSGAYGKSAPHSKGCYYKNIWMRSSYEIKFAFFLDCSGIKYLYESERFYFKDCTYCPDFYIPQWDLYIEIKGWWRDEAVKRFKLFKKNYPNKNIKVLMKPDLENLGVLI